MNKVISINLNGNSYQLDEDAYEALRAYLDKAQAALRDNPDRTEIMSDIEQAIGEKCARTLGPAKTVVLKSEIDRILLEMGPVVGAEAAGERAGGPQAGKDNMRAETHSFRRLFRIREGAMIGGICTGLAAYFSIDVTIVRVLFVLATLLTSGVGIPVYFVMMFVIPEASTSDEHYAAHGLPFNAQQIVDQAMGFAKGSQAAWRRHWRRQQRQFRRGWRSSAGDEFAWHGATFFPGAMMAALIVPLFIVINAALAVVLWLAIYTLATTGSVAGWTIPAGMPFWVAVLILGFLFALVTTPLSAARHMSYRVYGHSPTFAVFSGLVWLGAVAVVIWFGSQHQAEIRDFIARLPEMWNQIWTRLQQR